MQLYACGYIAETLIHGGEALASHPDGPAFPDIYPLPACSTTPIALSPRRQKAKSDPPVLAEAVEQPEEDEAKYGKPDRPAAMASLEVGSKEMGLAITIPWNLWWAASWPLALSTESNDGCEAERCRRVQRDRGSQHREIEFDIVRI